MKPKADIWTWFVNECNIMSRYFGLQKCDAEDLAEDVLLDLLNDKELARRIYERELRGVLSKIVKHKLYAITAKKFFDSKEDYCRYRKITNACDRYAIPALPANAYKIAAVIDDKNFSIQSVRRLLLIVKPQTDFVGGINDIERLMESKRVC